MKIIFTGGGSAGHVTPIIAVYREIKRMYPDEKIKFLYLGPKDPFGTNLLSQEGIKVKTILAGKIRRYLGVGAFFSNIIDVLIKIPIGILQAFLSLFFAAPDLIFSKGGYGSIPTVISGWILGIPIFLHESDISPGLANRFLSRFATEIFISFPRTEYFSPKKMILVGNPIRREILEGSSVRAKEIFHLIGGRARILILGGSQGAQRINDVVLVILPEILKDFELIHQVGTQNFESVKKEVEVIIPGESKKFYHTVPFLKEEQLKHAYAACDLIVGRAGSGTIFEVAALGKPSILIPLPEAAQNHQLKNAYSFAQNGATMIIEKINFTPHFFLERIKYIFSHPNETEKMEKAAREFSRPKAARVIAAYLIEYLKM